MADRLEAVLAHFSVSARVFHAGALCGINELSPAGGTGQLHLIREGTVEIRNGDGTHYFVDKPSLVLYPRPLSHRFITDAVVGAGFTCANLTFGGGAANPIAAALPSSLCLSLEELRGTDRILEVLFDEAFAQNCGRQAVLDRLFEVVLVQLLRHLMEAGQMQGGMLAGLSHPRLRLALIAMHETPAREWSLAELAATAGMSRSVFARAFRETVGCTPGLYLQSWRIALVQQGLQQGKSLKLLIHEVGYGSEAALSRAFKAQVGASPRQWKQAEQA